MKSMLLSLFSILLVANFAHSQITINSSTFPAAGDTLSASISVAPEGIDLGTVGIEQTWDFSTLVADLSNEVVYLPATDGSASAEYPTANLVTLQLGGGENYYRVDTTKMEFLGFFGTDPAGFGLSITARYTPPAIERVAPLSFSDTYSAEANVSLPFATDDIPIDLFAGLPISPDSIRFRVAEELNGEADAYGTLEVPEGSYEVLRVHQTLLRSTRLDAKVPFFGWQDVTDLVPIGEFLGVDTVETYIYWNNEIKQPIAAVSLNQEGTITRIEFIGEGADPVVSVNELVQQSVAMQVFPNPSSGQASLQLSGLEAGNYQVQVWNMHGMPVWTQSLSLQHGQNLQPLMLDRIPAGLYVVTLQAKQSGQVLGRTRWVIQQ